MTSRLQGSPFECPVEGREEHAGAREPQGGEARVVGDRVAKAVDVELGHPGQAAAGVGEQEPLVGLDQAGDAAGVEGGRDGAVTLSSGGPLDAVMYVRILIRARRKNPVPYG
jgi:hypothetical protein